MIVTTSRPLPRMVVYFSLAPPLTLALIAELLPVFCEEAPYDEFAQLP
jgi:hypothetical protein